MDMAILWWSRVCPDIEKGSGTPVETWEGFNQAEKAVRPSSATL